MPPGALATSRRPRPPLTAWRDWRSWPDSLARLWRRSLRFRTVLITLALTALAILDRPASGWRSRSRTTCSRLAHGAGARATSQRATRPRRRRSTPRRSQGDGVADPESHDAASATRSPQQSSTDMIAAFRIDRDAVAARTPELHAPGLDRGRDLATSCATRCRPNAEPAVVAVGRAPARRAVGRSRASSSASSSWCPTSARYELYLAYDLGSAVADARVRAGHAVDRRRSRSSLLIGAITWFVAALGDRSRSARPPTRARKLAAGELGVRLPVRGEDELATLGRSFNAMADSIESQIKELADLSLVQQRFVSDVSHELRTPLTTIRLAADMINDQRDDFDPATARAAELLHAQVQRFETLLDRPARDQPLRRRFGAARTRADEPRAPRRGRHRVDAAARRTARHRRAARRARRLLAGRDGSAPHPAHRAQPARQRDRARRGTPDRRHGRQQPAGRRARRARLRPRHEARRRRARLRPLLAGRPVAHAHDRRHRPRACRSRSATRGCTAASSRSGPSSVAARTSCSPSRGRAGGSPRRRRSRSIPATTRSRRSTTSG